jgi:phosphoribosylformylglycinamidine synthase
VVTRTDTPATAGYSEGQRIVLPVKHGEGRYVADAATLDALESEGRVVLRYAPGENPNGSMRDVAGVCSEGRNVVGLMPHPEHAVDPVLAGGTDGRALLAGIAGTLAAERTLSRSR